MELGMSGIVAITVIAYLMGETVKASGIANKWIPIICGFVGLLLGIVGMYVMPNFPAEDYITAAAVGIVSGLSATGIYESISNMKEK